MTESAPPGWYPDGSGRPRYWDGSQWTHLYGAPPVSPSAPVLPERPSYGGAWAIAGASAALLYVLLMLAAVPGADDVAYTAGRLVVAPLVGFGLGGFVASRLYGWKRAAGAVAFPLVIALVVLVVSALPDVSRNVQDRRELGGISGSRAVLPDSVRGWQSTENANTRAARTRALEPMAREMGFRPTLKFYVRGEGQLILLAVNPPPGGGFAEELRDSPVRVVGDMLQGARASDIVPVDSGIEGVALLCGSVVDGGAATCAWADSAAAGAATWMGIDVAEAGRQTKALLPHVRDPR